MHALQQCKKTAQRIKRAQAVLPSVIAMQRGCERDNHVA